MHINRGAYPTTQHRDGSVCGQCPRCHPGRQFGGDERCRVLPDARPWITCNCHRSTS